MPHSDWLVLWTPPHVISGSCMAGRGAAQDCGQRPQAGGEKGLLLYSLLLWQVWDERGGPLPRLAPRLAITEPKLSPARGIVVSMSFQHKINCTAHQPSGSQHLLAASTSSQKEPPQMWWQVSQLQPELGVTLQAQGAWFCHVRTQCVPKRAPLQPGTRDSSSRLLSYLLSPEAT